MYYTQSRARFILASSVHKNNQFNKRAPNSFRKKLIKLAHIIKSSQYKNFQQVLSHREKLNKTKCRWRT